METTKNRFSIRENGKYKVAGQLRDEARNLMLSTIEDDLTGIELLELGNLYREWDGGNTLYENTEDVINRELKHCDPVWLLEQDYDSWASYFAIDDWGGDLSFTDDALEGLDVYDVVDAILDEDLALHRLPDALKDIFEDWQEALTSLESVNKFRKEIDDTISAYTNCEADVSDLLILLGKLANNEDIWEKN